MSIDVVAAELVNLLRSQGLWVILAESCTGGLVAATLTKIPGVSNCFCGSAVTYLDEVKTQWLGVRAETLAARTAVSDEVAREMALGVLETTSKADIAVSITGHLGPNSPVGQDGMIFIGFVRKKESGTEIASKKFVLKTTSRSARQNEAAETLFNYAVEKLQSKNTS